MLWVLLIIYSLAKNWYSRLTCSCFWLKSLNDNFQILKFKDFVKAIKFQDSIFHPRISVLWNDCKMWECNLEEPDMSLLCLTLSKNIDNFYLQKSSSLEFIECCFDVINEQKQSHLLYKFILKVKGPHMLYN